MSVQSRVSSGTCYITVYSGTYLPVAMAVTVSVTINSSTGNIGREFVINIPKGGTEGSFSYPCGPSATGCSSKISNTSPTSIPGYTIVY